MKYHICQHLGLGDHIVTNAIIRKINRDIVKVLCVLEHNLESVKFMLRDVPNLEYRIVNDEFTMMQSMAAENNKIIDIGMYLDKTEYFNKCYYLQCNINFDERWSRFHVERDIDREIDLLSKYNIHEGEEYIFLHEDTKRNYTIKQKYIPTDIKIVQPSKDITNNIFDYLTLIERAKEIHVISSCFMFLIDSIKTDNKLYMHHYARYEPCYMQPLLKREWLLINN